MSLLTPALKFALSLMLVGIGLAAPTQSTADGVRVLDLNGRATNPFGSHDAKLLVFIFVRTDCPIANAYAPEIQRLQTRFSPRGVAFRLVYPGADESPEAIRRHLREFGYSCAALRDPRHVFARRSHVRVTPEAALYRPDGTLLYHGRIDDRYVDLGKARPAATRYDLAEALARALAGKSVTPAAGPPIGCFIEEGK